MSVAQSNIKLTQPVERQKALRHLNGVLAVMTPHEIDQAAVALASEYHERLGPPGEALQYPWVDVERAPLRLAQ